MHKLINEFDSNLGFHFSEMLNTPLVKPYWIYFSLSHKCTLSCQMCGVRHILKDYELETDILKRTLREISGWGSDCVIMLTGGEPFLRNDIFDIIDYASSLGLNIEVVSNGSLIDNPQIAARIVDSGLKNIAVSLDGISPQTHDYIRGAEGAYKKALDAISYLCQAKKTKKDGPQISVWTTIMKENVEELYKIIFLVRELGVECLVYHPVIVIQEDMQNTINRGSLWITDDQIGRLRRQIDQIYAYQKKYGLVAFLHDPYLWIKYFQRTLVRKDWKCNPFVFINIGPDGSVRSCGPAFGNIREISLTDCLNTKEATAARERMRRCQKPCLQTCWAKPEADSLTGIVQNFISGIQSADGDTGIKQKIISEKIELLTRYEELVSQNLKNAG